MGVRERAAVLTSSIAIHRSVDAPVEVVWEVMADPDVYATVAPNLASVEIVEGEAEGMVSRCVDTDGRVLMEECHRWEPGRVFAVTVDTDTSDFHRRLFTRFEGEWRVSPQDQEVLITLAFDFDPRYGPFGRILSSYFRYKAPSLIEPIFDGWEAEIESRIGELG